MKKNFTEIVFILDESGSMNGLQSDTIGGFNSLIGKQKKEEGEAVVTTILFSTGSRMIHDRVPLNNVPEMTEKDYCPNGCTALLDAVGDAVKHISKIHKYARPEDVPEHTLFIINTDGMENASKKYSTADVKKMISKEQEEHGWEFVFLGANIDAAETAASIGIAPEAAVDCYSDKMGSVIQYETMGVAVSSVRRGKKLAQSSEWRMAADEDFKNRRK